MKSLFSSTEPSRNTIIGKKRSSEQTTLPTDILVPFPDQPFELYSGERKENMLNSISEYGILNPILVRELDTGDYQEYQILSGHNRWTCARELGFAEVPVIILRDITDDEALMLVLDSNIQQRGISDMPISQQARIYAMDVAVNKRQGKRSDIIDEIESNLKILKNGTADTLYQGGTKLDTISDVGNKYGVSRMTITRFIRIDMLCSSLKVHIDTERIGVLAGVQLSYLSTAEQEFIAEVLDENKYKLSESKAKQLRTLSDKNLLNDNIIMQILDGSYNKSGKAANTQSGKQTRKTGEKVINKWISVNNGLPEEDVRVIVCCQTKKGVRNINLAYHTSGIWHGQGSMSGVIAWMSLPELPEEV